MDGGFTLSPGEEATGIALGVGTAIGFADSIAGRGGAIGPQGINVQQANQVTNALNRGLTLDQAMRALARGIFATPMMLTVNVMAMFNQVMSQFRVSQVEAVELDAATIASINAGLFSIGVMAIDEPDHDDNTFTMPAAVLGIAISTGKGMFGMAHNPDSTSPNFGWTDTFGLTSHPGDVAPGGAVPGAPGQSGTSAATDGTAPGSSPSEGSIPDI